MEVLNEDRRISRRLTLKEVPTIVSVSLQAQAVQVVNISTWGLLVRCSFRLPPGSSHPLEIARTSGSHRARGRVVRCEVAEISKCGIGYCVALRFDRRLDFVDSDPWSDFAAAEAPVQMPSTPTVFASQPEEWRQRMALNGW